MDTLLKIAIVTFILYRLFAAAGIPLKKMFHSLGIALKPGKKVPVFGNDYVEAKTFYRYKFGSIPCVAVIEDIDLTKAYQLIIDGNAGKVLAVYQRNRYDWEGKKLCFNKTLVVLSGRIMIYLGYNCAEILYNNKHYDAVEELVSRFTAFRLPVKEADNEMNIITVDAGDLELKPLKIKPQPLDLALYYNDDFIPIDELIRKRLEQENDKGIILLHGIPGTGKTSYLRHLIGTIKKRVLFVSPGVAGKLTNPEFVDLLIDNPNSVLVIEDAENIIMDRKYNSDSSVSNLLNVSDGLLSDCLNVQIICTFNSSVALVDNALMRKGRLIAKYEFGKLTTEKAMRLSAHLGFIQNITEPMTIAEITNPGEAETKQEREVIGFRRQETLMN